MSRKLNIKSWNSKLRVKIHELRVRILELRVRIHELRVQIHQLRVQIHELQVSIHEIGVQIHELRVGIHCSIVRSSRKQTPFSSKQANNYSSLEGYRKSFKKDRISSNAAKLICQSRRLGLVTDRSQKIDPLCAPLSKVGNYFPSLFNKGLQYRTANSQRSAISAHHNFIHGEAISKHPKVCA